MRYEIILLLFSALAIGGSLYGAAAAYYPKPEDSGSCYCNSDSQCDSITGDPGYYSCQGGCTPDPIVCGGSCTGVCSINTY